MGGALHKLKDSGVPLAAESRMARPTVFSEEALRPDNCRSQGNASAKLWGEPKKTQHSASLGWLGGAFISQLLHEVKLRWRRKIWVSFLLESNAEKETQVICTATKLIYSLKSCESCCFHFGERNIFKNGSVDGHTRYGPKSGFEASCSGLWSKNHFLITYI